MKGFDVIGIHVTLSTDFVNEPRDEPSDGHADLVDVGVIGSTFSITTVTLSNTTHTHRHTGRHTETQTETYRQTYIQAIQSDTKKQQCYHLLTVSV